MYYKHVICFALVIFLNNNLYSQNSLREYQATTVKKNTEGFGKYLGLSNEQKQQFEKTETEFFTRLTNLKPGGSPELAEQWKKQELKKILSQEQFDKYIKRQKMIDELMGAYQKKPRESTPVFIKNR
ncbi:hypothetical protein LL912_03695 [Niabella sp. CC-SYL272]|uniref:hypothetical protein n=1 Tax=Niabella agricola TaxID=2891571 RepID=UPI001F271146|nr:hypothetical protein [Niabella agricola]MCF3107874.1 hypothetical protein [Niabella agricola]